MDFLRMHPNDPCPPGYGDAGTGHCTRLHQTGHESNFYTADTFQVEHQYRDGYTLDPRDQVGRDALNRFNQAPEFQGRSVNPHTGKYVVYHDNKPHLSTRKYGLIATRHSYLGV